MKDTFLKILGILAAIVVVCLPIALYILLWIAVGPVGFWQKAFMICIPGAAILIVEFPVVMLAIFIYDAISNK